MAGIVTFHLAHDSGARSTLNTAKDLYNPLDWNHFALTYDGMWKRIYINGVEVASQPLIGPLFATGGNLYFGLERPDPALGRHACCSYELYKGLLDDVRLYDRALTRDEIRMLVDEPTFDGLIAKIQAMGLHKGMENALIAKAEAAKKSVGQGLVNEARESLNALLNQIAAQTSKKLTAAQAAELTACVNALIAALS